MRTLSETTVFNILSEETVPLRKKLAEIQALMASLDDPSYKAHYEVVIPCSHPSHKEARIRVETDDLKGLIKDVVVLWNTSNRGPREASDVYVFVIIDDKRVAIPSEYVKAITGFTTRDYAEKSELENHVVSLHPKGWV